MDDLKISDKEIKKLQIYLNGQNVKSNQKGSERDRNEEYLDIDGDPSTDPFINKGQDKTAGWSMNLALQVYDSNDWCSIPSDGFDYGND